MGSTPTRMPESAFQREWPVYEVWYLLFDCLSLDCAALLWERLVPDPRWVPGLRTIARETLRLEATPTQTTASRGAQIVANALGEIEARLGHDARLWLGEFAEFEFAFVPSLRPEEQKLGWSLYAIAFRDGEVPVISEETLIAHQSREASQSLAAALGARIVYRLEAWLASIDRPT